MSVDISVCRITRHATERYIRRIMRRTGAISPGLYRCAQGRLNRQLQVADKLVCHRTQQTTMQEAYRLRDCVVFVRQRSKREQPTITTVITFEQWEKGAR